MRLGHGKSSTANVGESQGGVLRPAPPTTMARPPSMARAGYVLRIREPNWFEHRLFNGPVIDVHVHVFSAGCPEAARMMRFLDHLRRNAVDRRRYDAVKRELAGRRWRYVQHYANAESEVVGEIMARADHEHA